MKRCFPVALAALGFAGCVKVPSEFDARVAMQVLHQEVLAIGIFIQTDARKVEREGNVLYEIDYHLEGEWEQDAFVGDDGSIRPLSERPPGADGAVYRGGESASLNGTVVFEHVDGGWKGPDGRVY